MENTVKVTKRDNFTAIRDILSGIMNSDVMYPIANENITYDSLVEFCDHELELLDKRSARSKAASEAKKEAADPMTDAIAAILPESFVSIDDVVGMMNDPEVTRGKVQYRLTQLVKSGAAEKGELTVVVDGKNKKIAAYRAVV